MWEPHGISWWRLDLVRFSSKLPIIPNPLHILLLLRPSTVDDRNSEGKCKGSPELGTPSCTSKAKYSLTPKSKPKQRANVFCLLSRWMMLMTDKQRNKNQNY